MQLIFSDLAWEDYLHWQATDAKTLKRIHALIADARRHPYEGLGKPEPIPSPSPVGHRIRSLEDGPPSPG